MESDSVVVIGSGPAGQASGKDIDCHPVVRMWNHEWQPADRYGSRYDYGLITRTDDVDQATRRPDKKWLFYNVPHHPEVTILDGTPVVMLKPGGWYSRAQAHGAKSPTRKGLKFTRGFAAVAGTIECLRPKRIIVIGMNILRDGVTGLRYYDAAALPYYKAAYPGMTAHLPKWAADEMPAGVRGEGPHDYFAESKVIREMAAEAGIELVWA